MLELPEVSTDRGWRTVLEMLLGRGAFAHKQIRKAHRLRIHMLHFNAGVHDVVQVNNYGTVGRNQETLGVYK